MKSLPAIGLALALAALRPACAFDVVLNAQGEYLDAYLVNGSAFPPRVVFIDPDPPRPDDPTSPPARVGRHVNGKLCFFPLGFGHNGQFVIADDTYREACLDRNPPQARCSETRRRSRNYVGRDPDGWGVFKRNGKWTKHHIHVPWNYPTDPQPQGTIDPQGCAFDGNGNLWGNDVGSGNFGQNDGSILVFFPGSRNTYETYCFLDKALGAPGMPTFDADGNLWVPESSALKLTKFSPPFPSSEADCANPEHLVTTPPTKTTIALPSGVLTPSGIARVPGNDHFYLGNVLLVTPAIDEIDHDGMFVRTISPMPRNPLGIAVGSDGTVYYSELNLDPMTFGTRCGYVSQVRFDGSGNPLPAETLGKDLRFPDGVTVVDSRQLHVRLDRLPPSPPVDPMGCGGE